MCWSSSKAKEGKSVGTLRYLTLKRTVFGDLGFSPHQT